MVHRCINRGGYGIGRISAKQDPEYRFERNTVEGPPPDHRPELGPCLIFTGADNGNGYGQFRYNGKGDYVHRYAWEREHGPIPTGMTVDHLCRVRRCANAKHLELVTGPENTTRGAKARPPREQCIRGHEYAVFGKNNQGSCRECPRIWSQKRWEKSRKPGSRRRILTATVIQVRSGEMTVRQASTLAGVSYEGLRKRVWRDVSADVRARDGGCVLCGSPDVDVHHRITRSRGPSARSIYGMDNLVSLCRHHHGWVGTNPGDAALVGLYLMSGEDPQRVAVHRHGREWVLFHPDGTVEHCPTNGSE